MHDENGMTLVELLTTVALGSVVLTTAMVLALPLIARETMRAALHDTGAFLQLAKMEAVSRNRSCRFALDTAAGTLTVWDTNGTSSVADDTLLHRGWLPDAVALARPDAGSAITVDPVGLGGTYGVVFTGAGMVADSPGDIFYRGGDAWGRVSVHSAGGVEIAFWDGTRWKAGT